MIWPTNYPHVFLIYELDVSCKLYYFLNNMLSTFSNFTNVYITIDTLIMVKYSQKFKFRKNYIYQIFIVLLIFFVSCVINLPFIVYLEVFLEICSTHITVKIIFNKNSNFPGKCFFIKIVISYN